MKRILFLFLLSLSLSPTCFAEESEDALNQTFEVHVVAGADGAEGDGTLIDATKEVTLSDFHVTRNKAKRLTKNEPDFFWMLFSALPFFDEILLAEEILEGEAPNFTWKSALAEELARDLFEIDKPKNARFTWSSTDLSIELSIEDESQGYSFDIDALLTEVTSDYPDFGTYTLELAQSDVIEAEALKEHFEQAEALLKEGFTVTQGDKTHTFPAQMKDIVAKQESEQVNISLNSPFMNYVLTTLEDLTNIEASDAVLKATSNNTITAHTTTEGRVVNGTKIITDLTQSTIEGAIEKGETTAVAVVQEVEGKVVNETGLDLGPLEYLATGSSNFKGSAYGRDFNVRKGLNEHFNNILIPPGDTFKFNSFLGPMTNSAGWLNSQAIFGSSLKSVPGAGICQVSTTVYRAALNAGLDIQQQKNHSWYVSFYKAYGDGLDATVFPSEGLDLTFVNNTGNYVLMEAYDKGYDAIVNFYGESDGRTVTLDGPYTASNQTEEAVAAVGSLSSKQIAWKQVIAWPDGRSESNWLLSSYNKGNVTQY